MSDIKPHMLPQQMKKPNIIKRRCLTDLTPLEIVNAAFTQDAHLDSNNHATSSGNDGQNHESSTYKNRIFENLVQFSLDHL